MSAGYDAENRLTSVGDNEFYGYDPSNKRVQKIQPNGDEFNEYIYFYGASGTLCTYQVYKYGTYPYYQGDPRCNLYFAGAGGTLGSQQRGEFREVGPAGDGRPGELLPMGRGEGNDQPECGEVRDVLSGFDGAGLCG